MSPWALNRLATALARGAVIGYPTDTIWGFGCHPLRPHSVDRILDIKRRAASKGLILLSSRIDYCVPYLDLGDTELESIRLPCARPTTWIVPASKACPQWLRGDHPTIAIRVTDHPLLRTLCTALESPLVSTSANRAGKSSVRNAWQMRRQFGKELDFIVTGFTAGGNRPSEIKFLHSGATLRSAD